MKYIFSVLVLFCISTVNAQDMIYRSSFEENDVNRLVFGLLQADMSVGSEIIRLPAFDAPITDSQTQLNAQIGADIVYQIWKVMDSQTLETVFTSGQENPVFNCPENGRGSYDVHLTVESSGEYSTFLQRRLITCTLPRTDAGRTVHSIDFSSGASQHFTNGQINGVTVQPGDLVRLSGTANPASNLQFIGFHGSEFAPIHFINDGLVEHAEAGKLLHIIDAEYVIFDGKGSDLHDYGIKLTSTNGTGETAVFVRGKSTGVELYGIEVNIDSGSGIEINTLGAATHNRSNWQHDNLRIHHNYMAAIEREGFYIGYTNDNNDNPPDFWAAYQIYDGKVYRNRIENCGWDGLQVANMVSGMEVHDNFIKNTGLLNVFGQSSSYQHNAGNGGYVYNNVFLGGTGANLQQGETGAVTYFFSNVFAGNINAGQNQAVYLFGGPSVDDSYYFFSNTMVSPSHGLRLNSQRGELNVFTLSHNLFLLGSESADTFQFATPEPDSTIITTVPNIQRAPSDDTDLCLADRADDDFSIVCQQSAALNTAPVSLDSVFFVEDIPFKQHMDITGRVFIDTNSYGAYWSSND